MTYSLRSSLALGVLLTLTLASCASYPDEQLKLAQAAMDEAQKVKAESFAAGDWESAKKAWDEGQALLAGSKYAQAGTMFLRAKSRFEKARDIATSLRERFLEDVRAAQHTLNIRYTDLKSNMAITRMPASVRKAMEEACLQIDQQAEKLSREMEEGEYVKAKATAQEALRQVYDAELKLQAAAKKR